MFGSKKSLKCTSLYYNDHKGLEKTIQKHKGPLDAIQEPDGFYKIKWDHIRTCTTVQNHTRGKNPLKLWKTKLFIFISSIIRYQMCHNT